MTEEQVAEKVNEIKQKQCSSSFQATTRDRRNYILRNKTDPPEVGKYNPSRRFIDPKIPAKSINQKEYSTEAKIRRVDHHFKHTKICSSLVKSLMLDSNAIVAIKGKAGSVAPKTDGANPLGDQSGSNQPENPTVLLESIGQKPSRNVQHAELSQKLSQNNKGHDQGTPERIANTEKISKLSRYQFPERSDSGRRFQVSVGKLPNGEQLKLYLRGNHFMVDSDQINTSSRLSQSKKKAHHK